MSWHIHSDEWVPHGVAGLEPKAEDAVRDTESALVVAGPGAGKTELLAQRASYLLETGLCPAPRAILAISFKRDAAKNLRERVASRCGRSLARRFASFTFDAFAKSLVDRFRLALLEALRPTADYAIDFTLDRDAQLRERVNAAGAGVGVSQAQLQRISPKKFFNNRVVGRELPVALAADADLSIKAAWAFWQHTLHGGVRSTVNFQMLGCLAELLLRVNPAIRDALRATYAFVFLDEFQDTTGVQYRLLHTAFRGSDAVLTAVGDHKQRIMLWAGAVEGVFDVFRREFNARPRDLEMNYRSAPRLVAIQHFLIASLDPQSSMPRAADDGADGEGECRLLVFPDDATEARYLAGMIEEWMYADGLATADVCILVKKLADPFSRTLRTTLADRGIQSRVENDIQDLLAEPLTVMVSAFLRLASQPRDPASWSALIDMLLRARGLAADEPSAMELGRELTAMITTLQAPLATANTAAELTELIRAMIGFLDPPTFRRLHPQYSQGDFFEKTIGDCARILAETRNRTSSWTVALDDFLGLHSIPIMTIAKSKGLEFHTVIVLGLEDYAFHHPDGNPAEEECNFFVAFSRAKKRVLFTFADQRNGHWQRREQIARYYGLLENAGVAIEVIEH
jgi:DNA helicase II / ATP-dependent DNA helicase PcrA